MRVAEAAAAAAAVTAGTLTGHGVDHATATRVMAGGSDRAHEDPAALNGMWATPDELDTESHNYKCLFLVELLQLLVLVLHLVDQVDEV